eukprot:scaffold13105_cov21-Tisochrysis_lutea.AAC.2
MNAMSIGSMLHKQRGANYFNLPLLLEQARPEGNSTHVQKWHLVETIEKRLKRRAAHPYYDRVKSGLKRRAAHPYYDIE